MSRASTLTDVAEFFEHHPGAHVLATAAAVGVAAVFGLRAARARGPRRAAWLALFVLELVDVALVASLGEIPADGSRIAESSETQAPLPRD